MAEVRIPVAGADGMELVFDSADIDELSTQAGIREVGTTPGGAVQRELTGIYRLAITFKPGKRALWQEAVGT